MSRRIDRMGWVWSMALVLAALATAAALAALVAQRFARGDLYPAGSSFSSAPEGTRALAEGLAATGIPVVRATRAADPRVCGAGCTLLHLRQRWSENIPIGLEERLRDGARLVVAFAPSDGKELPTSGTAWGEVGWERSSEGIAFTDLPAQARQIRPPTIVSLPVGAGTLVLVADGSFLENRALRENRQTDLIGEVVGLAESPHRVVFEETHLGVAERGGPMVLARRYGLLGAFGGLVVLAFLVSWQALSPLAPRRLATSGEDRADGLAVTDGLLALYRRGLPKRDVLAASLDAYRSFGGRLEPEAWSELERLAGASGTDVVAGYEALRQRIATFEGRSSE